MSTNSARVRSATAALALILAAPLAAQDEKPQASGKFEGRNWTFEALGAYAFPGEVGMDDEPGVKVAVSNGSFSTVSLDRLWDREYAIDTFLRSDEMLIVYFHFAKNGAYKGMTYYFASGDGCGFCYNGAVESTVKIEKGRIHGKVKQKPEPDEVSWDIAFDVPVAPSDYGTPLPAGFGEQGKIYAAYHESLNANSAEALRPLLDDDDAADLKEHPDELMSAKREDHPTQSYRITKGWVRGDWALLLVEGETSVMKVHTEVHLLKLAGTWRVYNEVLQVKLGG
jgi:hypothetical protein